MSWVDVSSGENPGVLSRVPGFADPKFYPGSNMKRETNHAPEKTE